jgi:hypothetical protein
MALTSASLLTHYALPNPIDDIPAPTISFEAARKLRRNLVLWFPVEVSDPTHIVIHDPFPLVNSPRG